MPDFKHKAREDLAYTLKIHIWTDSSVSYYVKSGESKVCFGNEVAHRAQTGKVRKTMKAERREVDISERMEHVQNERDDMEWASILCFFHQWP